MRKCSLYDHQIYGVIIILILLSSDYHTTIMSNDNTLISLYYHFIDTYFPLVNHSLLLEMVIFLVDLPIKIMIFHVYVSLPEGTISFYISHHVFCRDSPASQLPRSSHSRRPWRGVRREWCLRSPGFKSGPEWKMDEIIKSCMCVCLCLWCNA